MSAGLEPEETEFESLLRYKLDFSVAISICEIRALRIGEIGIQRGPISLDRPEAQVSSALAVN